MEFEAAFSKNGFPFTRVTGVATYYIRDKLKKKGARWNPTEKQWQVWGGALEMAFVKELESDAESAMPLVLAHEERKNAAKKDIADAAVPVALEPKALEPKALEAPKTIEQIRGTPYYHPLRDIAYQQLKAEGHPAWGPDTAEIYTHKHFDARGNMVIFAVNERMNVLLAASSGAGAAAPAASGAAASGAAVPAASGAGAAASGAAASGAAVPAASGAASKCAVCDEMYVEVHNCAELVALGF